MQVIYGFLLLAVVAFRSKVLWIAAAIICGVICIGWLYVGLVALHRVRSAWRDYPNTPESREYTAKRSQEDDKNKLEIKQ